MSPKKPGLLSPLEYQVMAHVEQGRSRPTLLKALDRPLKNATVHLSCAGWRPRVTRHRPTDGFVYEARVERAVAATGAIRRVMQRFFGDLRPAATTWSTKPDRPGGFESAAGTVPAAGTLERTHVNSLMHLTPRNL